MIYLQFILFAIVFSILYKRYFPVSGVQCIDIKNTQLEKRNVLLDLRDYDVSSKDPIPGAVNIPIAYLKRYSHTIPKKEVHVIAENPLEKNIGIRYLRKKGYKVLRYTLTECTCKKAGSAA
jgi:rhodanese-related sulfurtransferase